RMTAIASRIMPPNVERSETSQRVIGAVRPFAPLRVESGNEKRNHHHPFVLTDLVEFLFDDFENDCYCVTHNAIQC
ncbi:MAG: hypothetical protein AAB209_03890, partial [Bacteroidota bacterium]